MKFLLAFASFTSTALLTLQYRRQPRKALGFVIICGILYAVFVLPAFLGGTSFVKAAGVASAMLVWERFRSGGGEAVIHGGASFPTLLISSSNNSDAPPPLPLAQPKNAVQEAAQQPANYHHYESERQTDHALFEGIDTTFVIGVGIIIVFMFCMMSMLRWYTEAFSENDDGQKNNDDDLLLRTIGYNWATLILAAVF